METSKRAHSCCLRRFGACEANFLNGGGHRLRRSLFDKICDRSGLRYVDGVTSLDLNDRSTRALGHGTPGGGSLISDPTDSPLSGAKAAMYTRAETFGWFPASVITAPP